MTPEKKPHDDKKQTNPGAKPETADQAKKSGAAPQQTPARPAPQPSTTKK